MELECGLSVAHSERGRASLGDYRHGDCWHKTADGCLLNSPQAFFSEVPVDIGLTETAAGLGSYVTCSVAYS